jgi:hypothetical protein
LHPSSGKLRHLPGAEAIEKRTGLGGGRLLDIDGEAEAFRGGEGRFIRGGSATPVPTIRDLPK